MGIWENEYFMFAVFKRFFADERGAVTVDWTVLSAAAVSMAIASAGVIDDGVDALVGQVDAQLRTQQMSDSFVIHLSGHFEDAIEESLMSADDGEYFFEYANTLMNHEVIDGLQVGLEMMENGQLSEDDLPLLIALGSVAAQRNIVDDATLDYYFGFYGADPAYLTYF